MERAAKWLATAGLIQHLQGVVLPDQTKDRYQRSLHVLGLDNRDARRFELIEAMFKAGQHEESPFAIATLAGHLPDVTATPLYPAL